jgi:hypothetical protein
LTQSVKGYKIKATIGAYMLQLIYIAGPYRDKRGEWFVKQNIENAEEAALFVWKNGGVALCPHKNTSGFGGAADDNVWLEGDLALLSRCDAVLMVEGWEKSGGARAERDFAINSDIPVYTSYDGILNFLERQ